MPMHCKKKLPLSSLSKKSFQRVLCLNLFLASAITLMLFKSTILWVFVPSASMLPTLGIGENCMSIKTSESTVFHRGDIVCFSPYTEENNYLGEAESNRNLIYIKRLMGLPGDTLEIRNGVLHINGEPMDEPYIASGASPGDMAPLLVPDGYFFMLGDNRTRSEDSRYIGLIPKDNIRSRVLLHFSSISGYFLKE